MNRIANSTMKRNTVRGLLLAVRIISLAILPLTASPAVAQTTLPVLWTAGGLDAGSTGAGQAARIASDTSGNVAVVSGPSQARDLAVTSYTATGSFRWRSSVSPSSGTFVGDWVAAAPDGEFAAVGHNVDSHGRPIGSTLVRYTSDGTLRWRVDLVAYVSRLLVDTGGNAYLAISGQDIQLLKYNSSGVLLWTTGSSIGSPISAQSLALSPDEADAVLTGDIIGGATWVTAAFNAATGARKWLVTAAEGIATRDVVVDANRVYVTGEGNVGIYGFLTVVTYDRATGARLWRKDKKPADATGAAGLRMALAPDGSLVVAGQAARGFLDWYTVAFETNGAVRWEAVRDGGLNTDEVPRCILVMADGTTVVTGPGGPNLPGGYIQGVTAGYSPNGTLLWEGFSSMATVWATALPTGDVCATGGYDALITCWRISGIVSNQPPTAVIAATPSTGAAPLTVTFDGTGSTDPDGTISSYSWNFGDGGNSTAANPNHIYTSAGTYTATLTVTDNRGLSASDTVSIIVNPASSTVLRSAAINLSATLQGKKVSVTGNVVVKDGNGAAVSGAVVSATWTKPGVTAVAQTATTSSTGIAKFGTTGERGTYTLTVTNITRTGYTFDPANSVLSKSITK